MTSITRTTTHLGALGQIRTGDTRFRKPVLYPLSYEGSDLSVSGSTRTHVLRSSSY